MFKKLLFLFKYSKEIEILLAQKRKEKEDAEFQARRHHLKLCLKHQQERNRSHFSESNCDYCKLLKSSSNAQASGSAALDRHQVRQAVELAKEAKEGYLKARGWNRFEVKEGYPDLWKSSQGPTEILDTAFFLQARREDDIEAEAKEKQP